MNPRIQELLVEAGVINNNFNPLAYEQWYLDALEKFAESIVQGCIDKIETYRIPVGNSSSGELACEWTYDALKEIRDEIKEHFGVK